MEEEKEELRAYHDLDRDRRSMEYTIYQRELTDVTEQLETLENNRQAEISSTAQMRHQAHDRERMLAELEEELKAAKHTLQLQLSERKQTAEDMEEQTKVRAQIELLLRDQQDAQQSASANRRATEKELTTLDKELQTKEASLTMLTENFKKLSDSENSARQQLAVDQNRRDVLVAKRGRHGQFRNKKDRDDFLKKELRSVTVARDGENAQQQQLAEEVRQAAARLSEQESVVEKMRLQVAKIQQGDNTNHDEERVKQLKHQQTELNLRRKELWRQDAQLDAAIANYREEQRRAARALSGTMDRNTSTGLEAVKKIAERLGLTGVYGPLYELFEVDERYQTAVEVTAGNR